MLLSVSSAPLSAPLFLSAWRRGAEHLRQADGRAGVAVWQAREAKRVSRHAAIFGNTWRGIGMALANALSHGIDMALTWALT